MTDHCLFDFRLAQARMEDLLRDAGVDTRNPQAKLQSSSWAWPWFEPRRLPWSRPSSSTWPPSNQPTSAGWQRRLAQAAARLWFW